MSREGLVGVVGLGWWFQCSISPDGTVGCERITAG